MRWAPVSPARLPLPSRLTRPTADPVVPAARRALDVGAKGGQGGANSGVGGGAGGAGESGLGGNGGQNGTGGDSGLAQSGGGGRGGNGSTGRGGGILVATTGALILKPRLGAKKSRATDTITADSASMLLSGAGGPPGEPSPLEEVCPADRMA
jgi:hypothetical protein